MPSEFVEAASLLLQLRWLRSADSARCDRCRTEVPAFPFARMSALKRSTPSWTALLVPSGGRAGLRHPLSVERHPSRHDGKAVRAARKSRRCDYREIKKQDDFLYLRDRDFIQLGEDAGMYNRNVRKLLHDRLELHNNCGHPTRYQPGCEERSSSSRACC